MKNAEKIEPLPGNGKAMPPSLFFAHVYFEQKNRTLLEVPLYFPDYLKTAHRIKSMLLRAAVFSYLHQNAIFTNNHLKAFKKNDF